jgi:hypothetical protein
MRDENTLCVAVQGQDDARLTRTNGVWISEDGDPVRVEFEWGRRHTTVPSLDDRICDKQLTSHLIAHLLNPANEDLLQQILADLV